MNFRGILERKNEKTIFISISDIDDYELNMLKTLNRPNKTIVVNVGENQLSEENVDLTVKKEDDFDASADQIIALLDQTIMLDPEYSI